ncbi:type IV pilin-like G/H family protein [Leptolyngbya sp. PCC 6406]|uniref:type IV pilin-like G/H family protein n=1 Tax=Leptolyngbya sp. PCC 6406 TaxID=1173264 RepID=UPI0002ACDC23|nr:type IV pilin-like G/H family protein [Leptolyngbya sp. PCC 6406]
MTTNFKTRFLNHLIAKKEEGGFTLIELLVVIIIIGILAAIALPSFLNQANRARESEANTYAGSVNRGQQAYRLEQPRFATAFSELEVGIGTAAGDGTISTKFYKYAVGTGTTGNAATSASITATPLDVNLHGFRGCVDAVAGQSSAKLSKSSAVNTVPSAADCGL